MWCSALLLHAVAAAPRAFKVGVWQGGSTAGNVPANLQSLHAVVRSAEAQEVELVVLPELFLHGYGSSNALISNTAVRRDGSELKEVGRMAQKHGVSVCLPYAEAADLPAPAGGGPSVYNSVALFDARGKCVHHYRKINLAGRSERAAYLRGEPAELTPHVLRLPSGVSVSVGIAVCFDLEFPEAARSLALQGAEVLLAPTAVDALASTQRCLPARAIENAMWVLNANLEGAAPPSALVEEFGGQSAIYSPWGHAVVRAGELSGGSLLTAVVDLEDDRNAMRDLYLPERRSMIERGYYAPTLASQAASQASSRAAAAASRGGSSPKPAARGFGAAAPAKGSKKK